MLGKDVPAEFARGGNVHEHEDDCYNTKHELHSYAL